MSKLPRQGSFFSLTDAEKKGVPAGENFAKKREEANYLALAEAIAAGKTSYVRDNLHLLSDKNYAPIEGDNYSLLHQAAYLGKPEFVEILIEGGANINHQNKDGSTPLHVAATDISDQETKFKMVKALMEHGAKTDLLDKEGHTAQQFGGIAFEKAIESIAREKTDLRKVIEEKKDKPKVATLGAGAIQPLSPHSVEALNKEIYDALNRDSPISSVSPRARSTSPAPTPTSLNSSERGSSGRAF